MATGIAQPRARSALSAGFVGTYPPTRCGIATFGHALREAMAPARSGVVACVDAGERTRFGPEVVAELVRGSPSSIAAAGDLLDQFDVAIVQHEFGIYGGDDGDEVVDLVHAIHVPTLLVLHTALRAPSANQRAIIEELADRADAIVVQSHAARAQLLDAHDVDATSVHVIPHGARLNLLAAPRAADATRRPIVLTWGLLSRDKGIDVALAALARLRDLDPHPRYLVHGGTHPRVVEREGEAYRESLVEEARALQISDLVEFDERYLGTASVLAWARKADLVLLPYRSRDQVVSGVLVEALASGKPVIATRFPHAEELLAGGAGILVPHDDPEALAAALRRLLTDVALRERMAMAARRKAPELAWRSVGQRYLRLAAAASSARGSRVPR